VSSAAPSSPLAEKVRVAVACFRAAEGHAGPLYVQLEAFDNTLRGGHPDEPDRPGIKRLLARRLYAGEHKNLDGRWTIIVGHDLSDEKPTAVSVPVQHRVFEVAVRATPGDGPDVPFEGVFDLRAIEIEKAPK
jgi:hypothetical protein